MPLIEISAVSSTLSAVMVSFPVALLYLTDAMNGAGVPVQRNCSDRVSAKLALSRTETVKVADASTVAVPAMLPSAERDRPSGS